MDRRSLDAFFVSRIPLQMYKCAREGLHCYCVYMLLLLETNLYGHGLWVSRWMEEKQGAITLSEEGNGDQELLPQYAMCCSDSVRIA